MMRPLLLSAAAMTAAVVHAAVPADLVTTIPGFAPAPFKVCILPVRSVAAASAGTAHAFLRAPPAWRGPSCGACARQVYSGYVKVPHSAASTWEYDELSIHYELHMSQGNPDSDPVVTWHQGGCARDHHGTRDHAALASALHCAGVLAGHSPRGVPRGVASCVTPRRLARMACRPGGSSLYGAYTEMGYFQVRNCPAAPLLRPVPPTWGPPARLQKSRPRVVGRMGSILLDHHGPHLWRPRRLPTQ